jgi:peptide deformylase
MAASLTDSRHQIERKKNMFDRAAARHYQTLAKPENETNIMALRPIIILPDPKLRVVSAPLERVDAPLRKLMDDMVETMHDAPGIGLAAIQIGEPIRLVVIDLAKKDEPPQPRYFVNPEIVWSSDERSVYEEGCLSIPEYYEEVERPASVRARFLDREGKEQEIVAEGLLATALQHEIDHLNGVLFIDYISKLKRDRVVKKFVKMAKRAADGDRPL